MTDFVWLNLAILIIVAVLFTTVSAQSKNPVVEGFAGGSVTLPCTLTGSGTLEWKRDSDLILIKPPGGSAVIAEGPFRDSVELSGQTNLLIRSLAKARDNNREFTCTYAGGSASQDTPVRVLEKIGEAAIQESGDDTISVTRGIPKTLTCTVTGDPNPDPSYSWRVDGGQVSSQGQTFSLTADRSMTTVTCTATNTYSNGTELSRKEVTSSLNVLYLDEPEVRSPVTVIEGESVTLQCSAEGNPPPGYEWRRSGTKEVISTSGRYPVDTVGRSAAGEYTCTVSNSVGEYSPTVNLIVQYPPDVTVTYDEPSKTLSCSADGVPPNYSFRPWEHRLGGKLLQTLGTASTQSPATLRFEDSLTYEDTGSYVCQVTNQIKGVQSGQVVVRPETPAIFQAEPRNFKLGIGKTEKISVPFYTSSESLSVEWQKYGQSSTLPSHQEETGSVSLTIRGESVTIEGNVTTLTLTNVTQDDEGNYTVTVTVNINSNSEKRVRVVSVTVEAITEEAPGAFPVGAVVGGVVGGVIVIVIIVVLIIVLRGRSPKPGGSDGKEEKGSVKETEGSHEHLVRGAEQRGFTDPSWQDPDAEIATNDLYQSASFSRKLPPQDQRPAKPERTFTHKLKPDYVPPPGVRGRNKDQDMEMTENSVSSEKSVQNGAGRNRGKPIKSVKPLPPFDDTIEYEPTDLPSPSSRSQNNNRSPRKPGLSDEPVGGDGMRKAAVNPPKSPTPATDLDFVRRNRAY